MSPLKSRLYFSLLDVQEAGCRRSGVRLDPVAASRPYEPPTALKLLSYAACHLGRSIVPCFHCALELQVAEPSGICTCSGIQPPLAIKVENPRRS